MMIRKYLPPFVMWLVFEVIAVTLWFALDNIFFLFNFSYIGTAIAVGLVLYGKKKKYARNVVQFAVGLYMIVYLGFLCRENMQIEGFWYYLFLGVFEAATIHYVVAKIFGPFAIWAWVVWLCLLDSNGFRFASVQGTFQSTQAMENDPLFCFRSFSRICESALSFLKYPNKRGNYVAELHHWKYSLLCRWNCYSLQM